MTKRPSFRRFLKEALSEKEFKEEYEALNAEFELVKKFIKARQKANLSQIELAGRLKLKQPSIARLERGGYTSTSIATLSKVANALGCTLKISLQSKKRGS